MQTKRVRNNRITYGDLVGACLFVYIISYVAFFANETVGNIYNISLAMLITTGFLYIIKKKTMVFTRFFIVNFVYGLILIITYIYTPARSEGRYALLYYIVCLCVIFVITNYVNSTERIDKLIKAFVWSGVMVCIIVLEYYGTNIFLLAADSTEKASSSFRIGGEIGNSNSLGMTCMFSAILAFYLIQSKKVKKKYNILYIAICICCTVVALLTASKKAIIIFILGSTIMLMLKPDNRGFVSKLKKFFVACIILAGVYWLIKELPIFTSIELRLDSFMQLFAGSSFEDSDDYARVYMMQKGLQIFSEFPILGRGVYASAYYFGSYSHNNYVELLMNTGIIGFLVFYSIYFWYGIKIAKGRMQTSQYRTLVYFCFCTIIVLGGGLVYYFSPYFQVMMALLSVIFDFEEKQSSKTGRYSNRVQR